MRRTPVRAPKANAFCERLIGTIRRECLDFLVPINERHLQRIITEFVLHYNRGRPHSPLDDGATIIGREIDIITEENVIS